MSDITPTDSGNDAVEYDETDDNSDDSVLLDEETYVGTDTIYKNSAYDINKPMHTEPDSSEDGTRPGILLTAEEVVEAEKTAEESEKDHAFGVDGTNPRQTWRTDTAHPSQAKNQSDEALKNRARLDEEARQEVRNGVTTSDTPPDEEEEDDSEETFSEEEAATEETPSSSTPFS